MVCTVVHEWSTKGCFVGAMGSRTPYPCALRGEGGHGCMARPQQLQRRMHGANVMKDAPGIHGAECMQQPLCNNARSNAALVMHSRLHVAPWHALVFVVSLAFR
eukprot:1160746-Pelagomonas_calceolata.AAC.3